MAKTLDEVMADHRATHEAGGSEMTVHFPPDAPFEVVEEFFDRLAEMAYGLERGDWDPFVMGKRGTWFASEEDSNR